MEKIEKIISFSILDGSELTNEEKKMFLVAWEVRNNVQAPYSNYLVGVAIQIWNSDKIITGCNVERCSFSETTHAEQSAIDAAVKEFGPKTRIKKVVLVCGPRDIGLPVYFLEDMESTIQYAKPYCPIKQPLVPCGRCLQIIWENCHGDETVPLLGLHSSGAITKTTIGDAFPYKFGPVDLGIDYSKL
jgi:cytidine deaminase